MSIILNEGTKDNPEQNKKYCKNCMYAEAKKTGIVGRWLGECRRFPPQIIIGDNTMGSMWPMVGDSPLLYCAEFKEKK